MQINIKYPIWAFLASMLLFIALSPLMMVGVVQAAFISCIIFQSFTIVVLSRLCKKYEPGYLFISILLGASIIDLSIRIYSFEFTMMSFPVSIGEKCSIIAGYLVYKLIGVAKV